MGFEPMTSSFLDRRTNQLSYAALDTQWGQHTKVIVRWYRQYTLFFLADDYKWNVSIIGDWKIFLSICYQLNVPFYSIKITVRLLEPGHLEES